MKIKSIRKIFILGDLHLGVRNNSIEWSDIQSDYLINHFLKQVDDEGFDPDHDILVQVGDWNHVRESTNVRIYKQSLELAKILTTKFKRGVYVILGNHDVYYKDRTDTHSLEGFDKIYPNFHIFTKPERFIVDEHKFLMLPWIENLDELKSTVATHKNLDYIFCHADFKGFNLNKVTKLEHGLEATDTISFKRIYSGHIHIRQEKGNVLYVGTPYQMDRGDSGNTKGFYVLDVSQVGEVTEKFIENVVSPKYLKYDLLNLLPLTAPELQTLIKNNFVDVQIESDLLKKFQFSQFTDLIKDYGHRSIEFFNYSKEQVKNKSEVEIESKYEYNIFNILDHKVAELSLPEYRSTQITSKFKEIYDSLKNNKHYD
jgi:DNA repair exonuclease SbcCD nuclease subunit